MESLFAEFSSKAVFLAIYIEEAHAADEWPVGKTISFLNQPKNIVERCEAAKNFVIRKRYSVPMLVDPMTNPYQAQFAAWPFRFYVIHKERIVFKAEPDAIVLSYDITALRNVLQSLS